MMCERSSSVSKKSVASVEQCRKQRTDQKETMEMKGLSNEKPIRGKEIFCKELLE